MKIRNKELIKLIPVSGHTVNRYIKAGSFPQPEKIGREYWHNVDEMAVG
ncbi:MAG: hypothetical protein R3F02_06330 [Thiolinea sp.]